MRVRWLSAVALVVLAFVVAACGGTPGQKKPAASTSESTAQNVKTDGFDSLGPVTLRVVSSETGEGPKKAIQDLSAAFEKKYPNVTVKVSYRDFTSWIKQVKLSLASKNPPDVVALSARHEVVFLPPPDAE